MLIKIYLSLIACAILLFLSDYLLLALSIPQLPELATRVGLVLFLLALLLLLLQGSYAAVKQFYRSVNDFFSKPQRHIRRLLFIQNRKMQWAALLPFRKMQLHYFYERQRQRVLAADNRKQIKTLAHALTSELRTNKAYFSSAQIQCFRQQIKQCCKQGDTQTLLTLYQTINAAKHHEQI